MMKKIVLKGFLSLAALCASVTACTDGIGTGFGGNGLGKIALAAEVDASVASGRSSRKEYNAVVPGDLSVTLSSADGTYSRTWTSVADFPADQAFAVGPYTLEAFYGDEDSEGFDSPYYYGSQDIEVAENEVTKVTLTAALANAMVDVSYTQAFTDYMNSYSAEVHSAGGAYTKYEAGETRPVYTKAGDVSVNIEFVKPNGVGGKLEVAKFAAEARHFYHVKVDLSQGSGVAESITITIDDTLADDERTIDISDEVLNTAGPEVTAEGFTPGEQFSFFPGQDFETPKTWNIIARGGLKEITLSTQSASLLKQGWPAEIDLIAATAAEQQTLKNLGLSALGVFNNPDKLAVVDLTNVLSHIAYIDGGDNVNTFTLVVKDNYGKMSEPVSLVAETEKLTLEVSNPELYVGSASLLLDLDYNAGDPAKNVVIRYKNSGGTWTALPATYEKVADKKYRATLTVAAGTDDITVRGEATGITTAELTVARTPLVIPSSTPVNAFAHKAYLPITIGPKDNDAELLSQLMGEAKVVVISKSRAAETITAEADVANKQFVLSGLEDGTQYTIKIQNGSMDIANAQSVSFTTEPAAQLPNAGMEEWYRVKAAHSQTSMFGADAWVWHANAEGGEQFWATRNALTTATSSGPTPNYVSFSGTLSASGASGNAAEISSIGYGEGSTFTSSGGNCKHKAAGMLFIGSHSASSETSETFNYGQPWTSRPASFSFKYKYAPVAGESFKAYIVVENRDNGSVTELGRGELVSAESKSAFTPATVTVNYTNTSLKATHMYIVFISSTADSPTVNNVKGDKGAFQGFSDARRIGSVLTVDDIELIY